MQAKGLHLTSNINQTKERSAGIGSLPKTMLGDTKMVTWDETIYKTKKPARVSVNFEGMRLMMDASLDQIARVKGPIDNIEEECTRG
jgi:hypothetical protein